MVVATTQVDLEALKSRHPLGDVVEAAGVQLRGRGRVRQGVCPFYDEAEGLTRAGAWDWQAWPWCCVASD